nr:YdgA family protein [uncultured Undibacterium sp.]
MKKSSLAIAVVAALAIAYPAASWVTGKRLETKLSQINASEVLFSNFKIVKQNYTRGVFSSTQESTIEFSYADIFPATAATPASFQEPEAETAGAASEPAEAAPDMMPIIKPIQIQIINHITHGPIPGIAGIGAGKIDTEFVLDAATVAEIKKIFGDKKYLELQTVLNYGGGGTVKMSSPAVNTVVGVRQDKLNWKGLNLEFGFDAAYKKLKFDFNAPGMDIVSSDSSTTMNLGAIKMSGDAERAYMDGILYVGTSKASISSISFSNKLAPNAGFNLKDLVLESNTTRKTDLFDSVLKMGIQQIQVNNTEFGSFHYDYSLQNLHGPSFNRLFDALYAMDRKNLTPEKMAEIQGSLKKHGGEMLKYQPVLSLDRLSLTGKSGEFKASGKLLFVDVKPEDLENPMLLLAKLESKADVTLAESLVQELINGTQTEPEARNMMLGMFKTSVEPYEAQGYIVRNGGNLSSQILWKNNKLTINGKAYPAMPAAYDMAAGQAVEVK